MATRAMVRGTRRRAGRRRDPRRGRPARRGRHRPRRSGVPLAGPAERALMDAGRPTHCAPSRTDWPSTRAATSTCSLCRCSAGMRPRPSSPIMAGRSASGRSRRGADDRADLREQARDLERTRPLPTPSPSRPGHDRGRVDPHRGHVGPRGVARRQRRPGGDPDAVPGGTSASPRREAVLLARGSRDGRPTSSARRTRRPRASAPPAQDRDRSDRQAVPIAVTWRSRSPWSSPGTARRRSGGAQARRDPGPVGPRVGSPGARGRRPLERGDRGGAVHQPEDGSVHVTHILDKLGVTTASRRPRSPSASPRAATLAAIAD